jgi:AraC family transcriptional regulator
MSLMAIKDHEVHLEKNARLLYESRREIPGAVQYHIRRYARNDIVVPEEHAIFQYHYQPSQEQGNFVELKFCISGNMYCRMKHDSCNYCLAHRSSACSEKIESIDILSFVFNASLLEQFMRSRITENSFSDNLISFRHEYSFSRELTLCSRTRVILDGLLNHHYSDALENIYVNAQTQMLLLYSLDCMDEKQMDVINCKFLANEWDRDKIVKAREILLSHIGEPITIKELSRKVAMNECYLKKGFKEMFGTTIFEFYQGQRMEHAKFLLYEKGQTVTEVSVSLGYSSISHFSTAFKRHTGLKPCELLLR